MQKSRSKQKTKKIQFAFKSKDAKSVSLVGEFNDWNPGADPMQRDENGTWKKIKMLPPGSMGYKFFVDGEWTEDPENARTDPNCFGTHNNVIQVIESDRA